MAKKKSNINWYFLIGGILVLYYGLSIKQSQNTKELRKITVELLSDIKQVKGRRSSMDFKFWTTKYPNQFNILNGSISRGKHKPISELKQGQKIDIYITDNAFENLGIDNKDITINGLNLGEAELMSQQEFFANRKKYKMRLRIISIFTGIMLLINGLALISNRLNYWLISAFIGAIVIMRVFEIGLF